MWTEWLAMNEGLREFTTSLALLVNLGQDRKLAVEFCEVFGPLLAVLHNHKRFVLIPAEANASRP